jgi:cell division septation protein DedD
MVQVASFKDQDDADSFVEDLRKRGHSAYRQAANVPGRGVWHRVRIGAFKTKFQAELYKKKLEESERTIALVVDQSKVERQEQIRAAKLAERIRKYGSP